MDFEDEFVVALVECAHRHLRSRERFIKLKCVMVPSTCGMFVCVCVNIGSNWNRYSAFVVQEEFFYSISKHVMILQISKSCECRCTCLVQVSLKPSARLSQASFRADKEASAFTAVKKRVILRTNLCQGDYTIKIRQAVKAWNNWGKKDPEPVLFTQIITCVVRHNTNWYSTEHVNYLTGSRCAQ